MRECLEVTEGGLLASVEFLELVRLDIAIRNAPVRCISVNRSHDQLAVNSL